MFHLIINLKAYQTLIEAEAWIKAISKQLKRETLLARATINKKIEIVIAPATAHLYLFKQYQKRFNSLFKISAQDVSRYSQGSYTGETVANSLQGLIEYSLIGHSERRRFFGEDTRILNLKAKLAFGAQIIPIYCISNQKNNIPHFIKLVAYEPIDSIGTGNNLPINKLLFIRKEINLQTNQLFIYGGSVNQANVTEYLNHPLINGLLIARAALNPNEFLSLLRIITSFSQNY